MRRAAGHLTRIDSKPQARALYEASHDLHGDEWWLGANDREQEGKLAWHDGKTGGLVHWAGGEPDYYACGQDCVAFKDGGRGKMRDMHCASPRPFICRLPSK